MQISPINNINFNGKFKRTAELEKLLKISDQETLHRFNEVLERAGKVDDKMVFKISALSNFKFNKNAKTSTFHFHLKYFRLPDDNSLFRSDIHLVGVLYVEGGIPFAKVSRRNVRAQGCGAVNVNGEQHL